MIQKLKPLKRKLSDFWNKHIKKEEPLIFEENKPTKQRQHTKYNKDYYKERLLYFLRETKRKDLTEDEKKTLIKTILENISFKDLELANDTIYSIGLLLKDFKDFKYVNDSFVNIMKILKENNFLTISRLYFIDNCFFKLTLENKKQAFQEILEFGYHINPMSPEAELLKFSLNHFYLKYLRARDNIELPKTERLEYLKIFEALNNSLL